jgi:hypothetical protein
VIGSKVLILKCIVRIFSVQIRLLYLGLVICFLGEVGQFRKMLQHNSEEEWDGKGYENFKTQYWERLNLKKQNMKKGMAGSEVAIRCRTGIFTQKIRLLPPP